MQVVELLSCEMTKPEGQFWTHCPSTRKNPGKQLVQLASLRVEATLKSLIWHVKQLAVTASQAKEINGFTILPGLS